MPNRKLKYRFKRGDVVTPAYGLPSSGEHIGIVAAVTKHKNSTNRTVEVKWLHVDTDFYTLLEVWNHRDLRRASDDEKAIYALAGKL